MEKVFNRIAYSEAGVIEKIIYFPLYLLSILYGVAVRIRQALYSSGLFKIREIGCKVVSVGNITVGGTGKTPTVEFIARHLYERGVKAAILSRGYRRTGKGIGIVSDGKQLLLGPEEAGDEPYMLAKRIRTVPVLVGADRYELGRYALERFPLDVIILDDGFQHIRLKRDINILLVDGEKGFGNGHLLPRGPLREPLSAMKRADIFLITKASSDTGRISDISRIPPETPLFKSSYRAESLVSLRDGAKIGLDTISGHRATALSAIANPSSFINLLSSLGCSLVSEVSFPDHHSYTLKDLEESEEKARAANSEFIVTTEKDAVKLERFIKDLKGTPLYYLAIDLDMHGEEERFIDAVLTGIHG